MPCLILLIAANGWSQSVVVKKQNEKIKGESGEGYSTDLEGKPSDVSSLWTKFLKEVGRVKLFSSDPVVVTDPNFNGTVYPKGIIYGHVAENGNHTTVWLGMLPNEWDEKERDVANEQLEKLVYQFGVRFNRDKVQRQIDETQEAVDAVDRQTQRLINQNKDMIFQLSNNEKEKTHLEKRSKAAVKRRARKASLPPCAKTASCRPTSVKKARSSPCLRLAEARSRPRKRPSFSGSFPS